MLSAIAPFNIYNLKDIRPMGYKRAFRSVGLTYTNTY